MQCTEANLKAIKSVLPAKREDAIRRLKASGYTKAHAESLLNVGLWSGSVTCLNGLLSIR